MIHVTDAPRAVGVASKLISETARDALVARVRAEYETVRTDHEGREGAARRHTLSQARARKFTIDWRAGEPPQPTFLGLKSFDDYPLGDLVDRIDWTPFFRTWELAGTYPRILDDATVGEAARGLFKDAEAMLGRILRERLVRARAVIGFFPANSIGDDDVELYADDRREHRRAVIHTLRQQMVRGGDRANLALADFVAPKETGIADYVGGFAVTTGIGVDELAASYADQYDDYNAIMVKALADRLAEAFAERMHERVRKEFWGYAPDEDLANRDLMREAYGGIRPAPGYPACPDHTEKAALFDLLDAPARAGIRLTESYAMLPAAAVSGYYFWHPDSRYFGTGKLDRDQVENYARRKDMELDVMERWLAPVLNYTPKVPVSVS